MAHEFRDTTMQYVPVLGPCWISRCWCGWTSTYAQAEVVAKAYHREHQDWAEAGGSRG
jgi:hypothetical protein